MENQKAITKLMRELRKLDKTIHLSEGVNELEFEFDNYEFFINLNISIELSYEKGDYLTPPSTEVEDIEGCIDYVDYAKNEEDFIEIQLTEEQEQQVINLIIKNSELW